jgi:hypothetical protein
MKAKGSLIDETEFCLFSSPHGNDNITLRDQFHRELVNRPFQFYKRRQLFIGSHDEALPALPVAAMRVCNPDRSPLRIHG